ncbi:hypothetical protein ACSSS7_006439 [Eimeria intestinalis]
MAAIPHGVVDADVHPRWRLPFRDYGVQLSKSVTAEIFLATQLLPLLLLLVLLLVSVTEAAGCTVVPSARDPLPQLLPDCICGFSADAPSLCRRSSTGNSSCSSSNRRSSSFDGENESLATSSSLSGAASNGAASTVFACAQMGAPHQSSLSHSSAIFKSQQQQHQQQQQQERAVGTMELYSSSRSRSSSSGKWGGSSNRSSSNHSDSSLLKEPAAGAASGGMASDASSGRALRSSSSSSSSSDSSSSRSSKRGSSRSSVHSGSSLDASPHADETHDESSREASWRGARDGEGHGGAPVDGAALRVPTTDNLAGAAAAAVAVAASHLPLPAAARQVLRQFSVGFAGESEGAGGAPSRRSQRGPLRDFSRGEDDDLEEESSESEGKRIRRFLTGRGGPLRDKRGRGGPLRDKRGRGGLGGKRKGGTRRGFEHLPTGCLHVVFRFLLAKEILRASRVCTAWHEAVHGCIGAFAGVTRVCLDKGWLKLSSLKRQQVLLQLQRLQQLEVGSAVFTKGGLTLLENAPDFTGLGLRGLQRMLNQMPSLRRLTLGLEMLPDRALEGAVERSSISVSRRGRGSSSSSSSRGGPDRGRRVVSLGDGWTYEAGENTVEEDGRPSVGALGGPQGWRVQPPAGGEEVGGPEPIGGRSRGRPYRGRFTEANLSDIFAIACVRAGSTGCLKKIVLLQKDEQPLPPELEDDEGGEGSTDRPVVTTNTLSEFVSGAASFCARYVSHVFGSGSQEG